MDGSTTTGGEPGEAKEEGEEGQGGMQRFSPGLNVSSSPVTSSFPVEAGARTRLASVFLEQPNPMLRTADGVHTRDDAIRALASK